MRRKIFETTYLPRLLVILLFLFSIEIAASGSHQSEVSLRLITGDRLFITRSSKNDYSIRVEQQKRPCEKVAFITQKIGEKSFYYIPSDIHHLIPLKLDPRFFNIQFLMDHEIDDKKNDHFKKSWE